PIRRRHKQLQEDMRLPAPSCIKRTGQMDLPDGRVAMAGRLLMVFFSMMAPTATTMSLYRHHMHQETRILQTMPSRLKFVSINAVIAETSRYLPRQTTRQACITVILRGQILSKS